MKENLVICLMGPTATGKTNLAVQLHQHFPIDVVSVDSALVYRGMNIGTAKPDSETLASTPHRLIDICEPEQSYSAGNFVSDACREIDAIHADGRVPLLVGGTMMYFRSLIQGLADLPSANAEIRQQLDEEAQLHGWPHLHQRLANIDSLAAARIGTNDSQRIQRALEVFEISGKTLTAWHEEAAPVSSRYRFIKLALLPANREKLHHGIESRLKSMLNQGFIDEVRGLMRRPELTAKNSSMRAVGYRQIWAFLEGTYVRSVAEAKVLAATRQLAKRQMTWLRSETDLKTYDSLEGDPFDSISAYVTKQMDA